MSAAPSKDPPLPYVEYVQPALIIGILILSLGIHEAAHAWSAFKLGDDTAERMGRMTLNPIPHIDLFMTILLPGFLLLSTNGAFVFGGAKPVPVYKHRLRRPNRDMALVALAGPASNVLLAVLFTLLWKVAYFKGGYGQNDLIVTVLRMSAAYNVLLAVFNLLPIPPLDGSRVMAYLLPEKLRQPYVDLERIGMFLVIGFIYLLPNRYGANVLSDVVGWAISGLNTLTGGPW